MPPATIADRGKQQGAALLIMLVILIIAVSAFLLKSLNLSSINNARQKTTSAALAQAKQALLGYAVSDNNRPGELPCPDVDNDGMVTLADYSGSNCASLIGRLPWITLGLPDLRDGSGERLWYALSDPFHANGSAVLNSNTQGTLQVYGPDGVTLQTQANYSAVAVIFSAGSPVGTQTRDTVAQQNNASNYLDSANGRNNYTAGGPFIAGSRSSTFNDQLLLITTHDLIPLVEKRVATDVKKALASYYAANGYYPWADSLTDGSYASNYGLNRGWLPQNASSTNPNWPHNTTNDWPSNSFPSYFIPNQWYSVIYYSVAKNYTPDSADCSSCLYLMLSVDTLSAKVLFFMPGTYPGGTRSTSTLSQYLYDSTNNDSNDYYNTPSATTNDRNRIYWLSASGQWNQ